ncbi:ComEC/Rec2 family competence protein [Rhodopseudomonas palustris]|uniref:ComEC/Rec2 family competence protein n=1 Tax=Rhodopseudomonas palustris TaxID=1076 RepID=UPI002ACDC1F1|nr:ComEC/Rec2 family competence protein [Rhodopseudomonas palustris]WQH00771.1 ComEC/Rec2 family competence protein [Rhodopseudomonas palustris]
MERGDRAGARTKARTWPTRAATRAGARAPFGVSWGAGLWPAAAETLRDWARAEAGPGRLLPFVPVAFGAGIALYFAADHEPVAWVASLAAAVFGVAAFLLRRNRAFPLAVLITAFAAGFAVIALKAQRIAHPVLAKPVQAATLKGFVETREERERTDRFVLRVTEMDTAGRAPALPRVRLSVRKGTAPAVGSFVSLKARLLPPLSPLRPGAYDFGRDLYFQGIAASGFALGAVITQDPPAAGGWRLRYAATMQGMRDAIDARIRLALDGDQRSIATALITGRRDAISTPVNDAMFVSGLGHVLSISGYHMAVVAGVVFFAVRAALALIPALTVTFPIKKAAAAAALAAAAFYLLLSGAEVATQRSFLMTAVVLIAVMVDRRAITFRTLAIAALVVLLIAPESLVHPSFQMSFAATLGLVALVQIGMPGLFATADSSTTARAALWGGREIAMLALASLVAGLATTPYAAYHFHRVTPYGVIANLLAMPVVSAMVMPAGLLGLAAMPFGLDGVFWRIMEIGIDWMIVVSLWVAALPGAIGRIAAFGSGPLLLASLGVVLLGLLRTPLRYAGLALLGLSTGWALLTPQPEILIAGDGRQVALRGPDGRLRLMQSGGDQFRIRQWLAADADSRAADAPSLRDGVSCDADGCVAALADGGLVALSFRADGVADDCARATLVIALAQPPPDCAARLISAELLKSSGALALRRNEGADGGFVTVAVRPKGLDRPWSPAPADVPQESPGSAPTQRTPPRPAPVDATPAAPDQHDED